MRSVVCFLPLFAAVAGIGLRAALVAQVPLPPMPVSPQARARFIDFSAELMDRNVTVVLGRLGRMKEGPKKKLEDKDAHLGAGNTVSRISGTQFYKAPVRVRLLVGSWLCGCRSGVTPGKHLTIASEIQLARLPDGNYQRQLLGGSRATLEDDMFGLWVLAKASRGKTYEIRHAVPRPEKQERRGDTPPERAFEEDMEDHVAINKRIADLRMALQGAMGKAVGADGDGEGTARREDRDTAAARRTLQGILDRKVALKNLANAQLLEQHAGPWERRARELLKKPAGDGKEPR